MAKFSLNIYGKNDEIVKTHETNICPWGVYIQAAELGDTLKEKSATEQMHAVGEILKSVFMELTDEDLNRADVNDVMFTFQQIVNQGQKIKGGNSKN